ncbi:MAG TPA: glutamate-5-semialdehyde dehydrogenase [Planctomycetaceae bacterium]|nr:glutamate-5-semialdehyde dehydrogenase [Planctomycetaceae bacterium]
MSHHAEYARQLADRARAASRQLLSACGADKQRWLHRAADALQTRSAELVSRNEQDLAKAPEYGLNAAAIDRLRLTPPRIAEIAQALRDVAALSDPVGEVIEGYHRPNGLRVEKRRVPLGVVFFIYESRPNVTADAAALCVKSGNAVILRGGKEALQSNVALYRILKDTLVECNLPEHAVQLVATPDREVVGEMLKLRGLIDVTIPRGGKSLIERVAAEATMPVIKHFDGLCHVYVDAAADLEMALNILRNSKCQRTGVCNAAECVLIHQAVAEKFLPMMAAMFAAENVEIRGCPKTCAAISSAKPATEDDYRTEYLDKIISSRVVNSLDEAIDHIARFGSQHTDTIVTHDLRAADRFVALVDSSAVTVNASTRFNDGGELGLGAEIGISTDKFHARGPCGLRELTSYKWIVRGDGQIRG